LLVFVAAERREFSGLLRHAERVCKLDWPLSFARSASLNGMPVLLIANGPGPKLAGEAVDVARKREELNALVSIGFCGALDPALGACDIVVASQVLIPSRDCEGAVQEEAAQPAAYSLRSTTRIARLLSLDRVVSTAAEKSELRETGADVVEMEAGAVARKAREWSIPFFAIKVVTDRADESFPLDFNRMLRTDGRFNLVRILAAACRNPKLFPALLQLDKRTKSAAEALGDFIADTRF